MPKPTLLLPLLIFLAAACQSDVPDDTPNPTEFDAGFAESFPRVTITTFADGREVARTSLDASAESAIGGDLVFHLIRLDYGEFVVVHARDHGSECWVFWSIDPAQFGEPAPEDGGGLRDPCHGSCWASSVPASSVPPPLRLRATATPSAVIETATPAPAEPATAPRVAWTATDLLAALAAEGIDVQPTGASVACAEVDGLPGDIHFVLWVYDSAAAAAAEWSVGSYSAQHPVLRCN